MSATVLEHPLVRDYLRRLDAACISLPAAQARELREQIVAHLDEALPPDAADDQVAAELGRLGAPAALAAEVAGGAIDPLARAPGLRLVRWLARVRWQVWASIALAVAVLATALTYIIAVLTAAPLSGGGLSAWWFRQDAAHATLTQTIVGDQWTVPERFHQQQGFLTGVSNDSDWTQTIVGVAANSQSPLLPMTVAVGIGPQDGDGSYSAQTRWVLPAPIPPHSSRVIRVLWSSDICNQPGASIGFTNIWLQVKVGLFTRTENVPFDNLAFVMSGNKASSEHCL